jgi:N-acetylneuraminic acid mutarotase
MQKQRYLHWIVNSWDGSQNRIFAIGGQYKLDIHDSIEWYDFSSNKWILKSNMNTPRTMFSATWIQDFIYVFGGFKDAQYYYAEPTFERYSIINDSWEQIDLLDTQISFIAGAIITKAKDNQILILGGVNTQTQLQTLHKYIPESGNFEELNSEGLWVSQAKFLTTNGTNFKLIGGSNAFRLLEYNLNTNEWTASADEQGVLSYLDQLNGFTKNINTHIYQLFNYSTQISHNFY